jgi:hypothetical protein
MNTSIVDEQGTSGTEGLFTAFRQERGFNFRWLYFAAVPLVPLLAVVATWVSMQGQERAMRIITPHGIKVVNPGMSQQEVRGLLGHPIGREARADGADCFLHGMFAMTEPTTLVYMLCYESGLLKDMTTRRYSLWTADPTGAFMPAGVNMGDPKASEKATPAAKP